MKDCNEISNCAMREEEELLEEERRVELGAEQGERAGQEEVN